MVSARLRFIESRHNSRVKELRAAFERPGRPNACHDGRPGGRNDGWIALEGEHLILEALRSGLILEAVFVVAGCEDRLERLPVMEATEILSLPADVLASAVSTETPQPVAALARRPGFSLADLLTKATPLLLVAAGLQDPGNLGTLIRSAEAFGASGCILLPGTTSPWNPKALRASSGSAFRLPVVACGVDEMRALLKQNNIRLLAAMAGDGQAADGLEQFAGPSAILIGNEGAGLSPELVAMADARITIHYPGMTESLNAAVAGSVLLYEAARQRLLARSRA